MTVIQHFFDRLQKRPLPFLGFLALLVASISLMTLENGRRVLSEVAEEHYENERVLRGGDYKIAIFGESDSWGAGLENRYKAYPYLIEGSPKITSYAFYNAGPNRASVCTESMVGDEELYDVIILEFYYRAPEGLVPLAKRLRERFPDAIMIICPLWKPWMLNRKETAATVGQRPRDELIEEWRMRMELPKGVLTYSHPDLFNAIVNDVRGDWYFQDHEQAEKSLAQAIKVSNAFTARLPTPETRIQIAKYLSWFDPNYGHLRDDAHHYIAKQIDSIIHRHLPGTQGTFGTWGKGDSCHMWFESGASPIEHSPNIHMEQYPDMEGNHALEIPPDGGWIKVKNPFDDKRRLFLSFLATNGVSHPSTNITIQAADFSEPFTLDPHHHIDSKRVHPVKTTAVGWFPPGKHVIKLKPLEKTKYPFRLVGTTITDESTIPDLHTFGPLMSFKS